MNKLKRFVKKITNVVQIVIEQIINIFMTEIFHELLKDVLILLFLRCFSKSVFRPSSDECFIMNVEWFQNSTYIPEHSLEFPCHIPLYLI